MWWQQSFNSFSTAQLYVIMATPIMACITFHYLSKYKFEHFAKIIPVISILVGIGKISALYYTLSEVNNIIEYIGLLMMTLVHFYHTLATQEYLILWMKSSLMQQRNKNLLNSFKLLWNFIIINLTQHFKMIACLSFNTFQVINYFNYLFESQNHWDNWSEIGHFLISFIALDSIFYYPIIAAVTAVAYNENDNESSMNCSFQQMNKNSNNLSNRLKHLKRVFLFSLFIAVIMMLHPLFNFPYLTFDDFNGTFVINQIYNFAILVTIVSSMLYCEVDIRYYYAQKIVENIKSLDYMHEDSEVALFSLSQHSATTDDSQVELFSSSLNSTMTGDSTVVEDSIITEESNVMTVDSVFVEDSIIIEEANVLKNDSAIIDESNVIEDDSTSVSDSNVIENDSTSMNDSNVIENDSTSVNDSNVIEEMNIMNTTIESNLLGDNSVFSNGILCEEEEEEELDEKDQQILNKLRKGLVKPYNLDIIASSNKKAVQIRRVFMSEHCKPSAIASIPYNNYPFDIVHQQCCENVIGYITIPLGLVGPCVVNSKTFWIPLATSEGCLVASVNRGFSVIRRCGGVYSFITNDGMTRSPILQAKSASDCIILRNWLNTQRNYNNIRDIFESTSRYAKLISINCTITGKLIYIRFKATTGDAMGMNMVSKAVESSIEYITSLFPNFAIISLSGNHCSDKKAAAINWINGRGKSVTCEANIQADVIKQILKVDSVDKLVELNTKKNYIGSALAGSIGGFNAHASNSVAAIFAATGQDLGQVVESSSCITFLDKNTDGSLYISCTMPSLEVGTVGGGTILPTQQACLQLMNLFDSGIGSPAESLAMLICATVLAGELSLLSSLCEGTLVKSHLIHNRSQTSISNLCPNSITNSSTSMKPCNVKSSAMKNCDSYEKFRMVSNLTTHKTCPML